MKTVNVFLLSLTILIGTVLASSSSFANNDSVVDNVSIQIPIACTMNGTNMNSHNASIVNGTYEEDIGTTTLKAFCNDAEGFAIYAAGYTGDEIGGTNSNKLVGTSASGNATIVTGLATSAGNPDVSNWAMKLATPSSPAPTYPIVIDSAPNIGDSTNASFSNYHTVPNEYVKVAHRNSGTDVGTNAEGSTLTTTYRAYISKTQAADTYSGKVIYTLVHPSTTPIPKSTMLDIGQTVNSKMKTLAAGTETAYNAKTSDIKAVRMADSLPSGFTPSEANTVSTSTSKHPIYIFFDNTNDAGIMYFYTGGYQVVMNSDSSYLFNGNLNLADISGLSNWDSSNVTNLRNLLFNSFELTNLNALANWDTSNVESLYATFGIGGGSEPFTTGRRPKLADISGLANWDTSNVTTIAGLFQSQTSITNLDALFNWDTSNVNDMMCAFLAMFSLSDISGVTNWNTSNVTNMYATFASTAIRSLDALASWDVSNVESIRMMFGSGGDVYASFGITSQVEDISALVNWKNKLSNVTNMRALFLYAVNLSDISPIKDWDVSNVTDMQQMFKHTHSLTDASIIKDWDVRNVTATAGSSSSSLNNFNDMFGDSPAILNPFTLRAGTWNSAGTYVPSA